MTAFGSDTGRNDSLGKPGASTCVQHLVPVMMGAGERLYDGVGRPTLEPVEVIASPTVTHLRYRVRR